MIDDVGLRRDSLVRILEVVRGLGVGEGLEVTLARVAAAVVDVLGFGAVVVNVKVPGGGLVVSTATGPPEVRDMVGETMTHEVWLGLLDACERWGELRFHENLAEVDALGGVSYRDPHRTHYLSASPDGERRIWQPEYALLAPMWAGENALLGVLSVDLPISGLIPDAEQCAMLELFAGQAGAAIAEAARIGDAEDQQLQYRAVFLDSPIPTAMLGLDSTVVEVNRAFEELTGRIECELRGLDLTAVFGAETRHAGVEDRRVLRVDDEERWAHVRVQRIESAYGTRFVCTAEDRSASHLALDHLRLRAERDDLTGLGVKSLAMTELRDRLEHQAEDDLVAFLFCDLDGFKAVNDGHGHLVGDRVLTEIAACLRECVEDGDLVCRLGGDEFGIVATRTTVDGIEDLARRCVGKQSSVHGRMSVGVCIVPAGSGRTAEAVVEAADSMLYRTKGDGGGTWRSTVLGPAVGKLS
ncbi:diguanylate cyclase [Rhodococcus sp. 14-2470-1a]|uniref:GGDEF domain-containing protein n=1 Tax=Rhodococcus sp. 14-2470-1a TaxID=2023150 RepID=UPI000B9B0311|nr:sensor domain-containing diguanylate cyclase [Rhodococcus sp. 14-2470-1a]OZF48486.1 PAS domain S-box protein [Rhodococcus sp. 14-2470-1a]